MSDYQVHEIPEDKIDLDTRALENFKSGISSGWDDWISNRRVFLYHPQTKTTYLAPLGTHHGWVEKYVASLGNINEMYEGMIHTNQNFDEGHGPIHWWYRPKDQEAVENHLYQQGHAVDWRTQPEEELDMNDDNLWKEASAYQIYDHGQEMYAPPASQFGSNWREQWILHRKPFLYDPDTKSIHVGPQGVHHGALHDFLEYNKNMGVGNTRGFHEGMIHLAPETTPEYYDAIDWWNPPLDRSQVEQQLIQEGHAVPWERQNDAVDMNDEDLWHDASARTANAFEGIAPTVSEHDSRMKRLHDWSTRPWIYDHDTNVIHVGPLGSFHTDMIGVPAVNNWLGNNQYTGGRIQGPEVSARDIRDEHGNFKPDVYNKWQPEHIFPYRGYDRYWNHVAPALAAYFPTASDQEQDDDDDLWNYSSSHTSASRDEVHLSLDVPERIRKRIALWVKQLELPEEEYLDPSEYHITMAYAEHGLHDDVVRRAADRFNYTGLKFEGKRLTKFNDAVVIELRCEHFNEYADELNTWLEEQGVTVARYEGGFKPHITVAYSESSPRAALPPLSFRAGRMNFSTPRPLREAAARYPFSLSVSPPDHWVGQDYNKDGASHEWRDHEYTQRMPLAYDKDRNEMYIGRPGQYHMHLSEEYGLPPLEGQWESQKYNPKSMHVGYIHLPKPNEIGEPYDYKDGKLGWYGTPPENNDELLNHLGIQPMEDLSQDESLWKEAGGWDRLGWTPGSPGKAMYIARPFSPPRTVTWNVDANSSMAGPHHAAMARQLGMSDEDFHGDLRRGHISLMRIEPNGNIYDTYTGAKVPEPVLKAHPELSVGGPDYADDEMWKEANEPPSELPTIREEQSSYKNGPHDNHTRPWIYDHTKNIIHVGPLGSHHVDMMNVPATKYWLGGQFTGGRIAGNPVPDVFTNDLKDPEQLARVTQQWTPQSVYSYPGGSFARYDQHVDKVMPAFERWLPGVKRLSPTWADDSGWDDYDDYDDLDVFRTPPRTSENRWPGAPNDPLMLKQVQDPKPSWEWMKHEHDLDEHNRCRTCGEQLELSAIGDGADSPLDAPSDPVTDLQRPV